MRALWMSLLIGTLLAPGTAHDPPAVVQADQAWRDRGEMRTVCGQVVDSSWASSVASAPTYLYLERPRPEQVFTVDIPATSRDLFGESPEKSFRGKHICVTGKIETDGADGAVDRKHRARVVVTEEDQIVVG